MTKVLDNYGQSVFACYIQPTHFRLLHFHWTSVVWYISRIIALVLLGKFFESCDCDCKCLPLMSLIIILLCSIQQVMIGTQLIFVKQRKREEELILKNSGSGNQSMVSKFHNGAKALMKTYFKSFFKDYQSDNIFHTLQTLKINKIFFSKL